MEFWQDFLFGYYNRGNAAKLVASASAALRAPPPVDPAIPLDRFTWDGATFHYDDSGEVTYYEDGGREGENFYVWDFEDDSETRFISVEKWGRRKFEVFHLWEVDAEDIEVLAVLGEGACFGEQSFIMREPVQALACIMIAS